MRVAFESVLWLWRGRHHSKYSSDRLGNPCASASPHVRTNSFASHTLTRDPWFAIKHRKSRTIFEFGQRFAGFFIKRCALCLQTHTHTHTCTRVLSVSISSLLFQLVHTKLSHFRSFPRLLLYHFHLSFPFFLFCACSIFIKLCTLISTDRTERSKFCGGDSSLPGVESGEVYPQSIRKIEAKTIRQNTKNQKVDRHWSSLFTRVKARLLPSVSASSTIALPGEDSSIRSSRPGIVDLWRSVNTVSDQAILI